MTNQPSAIRLLSLLTLLGLIWGTGNSIARFATILIPFVVTSGHFYTPHLPPLIADWIILLEIGLSSLGYVLFFYLIRVAGPVYYGMVDTIVMLTNLAWGYWLFGESLNRYSGAAFILILLGLWLVTRTQRVATSAQSHDRKGVHRSY